MRGNRLPRHASRVAPATEGGDRGAREGDETGENPSSAMRVTGKGGAENHDADKTDRQAGERMSRGRSRFRTRGGGEQKLDMGEP
jgi:uncharacterized membrane protein